METDRFDRIVRSLAIAPSRRGVFGLLTTAVLTRGFLSAGGRDAASAKRGKKPKRCKPACSVCQTCRKGKCKPNTKGDGLPCVDGKVCDGGRCLNPKCESDLDCLDAAQSCQFGPRCQSICSAGACPDGCNFCAVRYFQSGVRIRACANSFTFGDNPAACTADSDCPAEEPLCVRFPASSCIQGTCGTCAISLESCV
jgi:hypothetical protein